FASGLNGAYLPASALKGALRTAVICGLAGQHASKIAAERARSEGKVSKQLTQSIEDSVLGNGGANSLRLIAASDSNPVAETVFKIYLLRVSTLESKGGKYELGWKLAPRGNVRRPEEGTPLFSEMALPGTVFEGELRRNEFLTQPEIA